MGYRILVVDDEITLVKTVRAYLDNEGYTVRTAPDGLTADETADPFPGYNTTHLLRDGETSSMLSVNAYNDQVFLHQWHGDFVEIAGEEHD
jgi:CheY-like chemotaxis protein